MFNIQKKKSSRMIALDIETTGMNKLGLIFSGHRVIEIGAVEIINRKFTGNDFHVYINPNRSIDPEAFNIHGISETFLSDKPNFSKIYENFLEYIENSDIIVHNANFDIQFLEYEIQIINPNIVKISKINKIIDTLNIARSIFPGKKNNLNALCERYNINISHRDLHNAIIDAKLLSELYLRMTRVQKKINLIQEKIQQTSHKESFLQKNDLIVLYASEKENIMHAKYLRKMKENHSCLWITKK
ncbi:DNA polymerase III subunit epsilon [Buchnera aphidicola]|uniref:DNA polymerase III subunit epsilon n=1 Tax=Buchnera aphidicola TaxID=9 RepID=UPI0034638F45